jgi:hypothetical protein
MKPARSRMSRLQGRRLVVLALCMAACAACTAEDLPGVAPEIMPENTVTRHETERIRIANRAGGLIEVSRDRGETWVPVGRVVAPATSVNRLGYTASKWARDSSVAATAVNGIHIKVCGDAASGRGVIFSVAPGGEVLGAAATEVGSRAAITTDIPGGEAIFGGGLGPYVGDPVQFERGGKTAPLGPGYVPTVGDSIVIVRLRPDRYPLYMTFENKHGGLIRIEYADEAPRVIGQVLRPVVGVGRFEGQVYAGAGRIRANHCGVIDVSTAPEGRMGGFQIIPRAHAASPEMSYLKEKTQWMVVGPVSALSPSMEGLAPLFSGFLLPSYRVADFSGAHSDWLERVLSRCMVEFRMNGGDWRPVPRIYFDEDIPPGTVVRFADEVRIGADLRPYAPLPGTADGVLRDVTGIRIVFAKTDYWPDCSRADLAPTPAPVPAPPVAAPTAK